MTTAFAAGPYAWQLLAARQLIMMHASGSLVHYEWNRPVVASRARAIAETLKEPRRNCFGPAPMVIARRQVTDTFATNYIVDGQHRLEALLIADREAPEIVDAAVVLVCWVTVESDEEVRREFKLVNQGTPVPAAYYNKEVGDVLSAAVATLAKAFPLAVATTDTWQRPKFGTRNTVECLSSQTSIRDSITLHGASAKDILAFIMRENDRLRAQFENDDVAESLALNYGASAAIVDRAVKSRFYLGIIKDWHAHVASNYAAAVDAAAAAAASAATGASTSAAAGAASTSAAAGASTSAAAGASTSAAAGASSTSVAPYVVVGRHNEVVMKWTK